MDTHQALDQDLARDPPDKGAWSVYADQLIEAGDPFGEIVARAAKGCSSARALEAARERQDPSYWPVSIFSFGYPPRVTFRMGLWSEIELIISLLEEDDGETIEKIRDTCAHPAARRLRLLSLAFEPQMDWEDHIYHLSALAGLDVPLSLDLGARFGGYEPLAQIPGLRAVKLGLQSGERLPPLQGLRRLEIEWTSAESHLGWISEMSSLEALTLPFDAAPAGLEALAALPLEELSLSWMGRSTRTDWGQLLSMPGLTHLGLSGRIGDSSSLFSALEQLSSLRSLSIGSWSFEKLPDTLCHQITALSLSHTSDGSLQALSRFDSLTHLTLLGESPRGSVLKKIPSLSALSLSYLDALPDLGGLHLERLEVAAGHFPRNLVERLRAVGSLRELRFDVLPDPKLLAQLSGLGAVPGLRALDLRHCLTVPERLRWRFEGDELPWAIAALAGR